MAFLNKGLTITLRDERAGHVDEKGEALEVKYCYAGGSGRCGRCKAAAGGQGRAVGGALPL